MDRVVAHSPLLAVALGAIVCASVAQPSAQFDLGPRTDVLAIQRRLVDLQLEHASDLVGVPVRYVDHDEEIEADRGRLPDGVARLGPALERLVRQLGRYPPEARGRLVRAIELQDTLWDGEEHWSGWSWCDRKLVRLALDRGPGRTWWTLHHELGHQLWCLPDTDRDAWLSLGAAPNAPSLLDRGFVSAYAQRSPVEDYAEVTAKLFVDPYRLELACHRSPLIAAKRDLVMDRLYELSPDFQLW